MICMGAKIWIMMLVYKKLAYITVDGIIISVKKIIKCKVALTSIITTAYYLRKHQKYVIGTIINVIKQPQIIFLPLK